MHWLHPLRLIPYHIKSHVVCIFINVKNERFLLVANISLLIFGLYSFLSQTYISSSYCFIIQKFFKKVAIGHPFAFPNNTSTQRLQQFPWRILKNLVSTSQKLNIFHTNRRWSKCWKEYCSVSSRTKRIKHTALQNKLYTFSEHVS